MSSEKRISALVNLYNLGMLEEDTIIYFDPFKSTRSKIIIGEDYILRNL